MINSSKRNLSIDILKGYGIILMVIGHSGCPKWMHDFIYAFHMPLFFICSGYLYRPLKSTKEIISFAKRRITRLYVPYLKWSILFLILHNLFYKINIYSDEFGYLSNTSSLYNISDFFVHFKRIVFYMNGHEELLGGFWFLKTLLISSIIFSVIDYLSQRCKDSNLKYLTLFICLLTLTFFTKHTNIHFWIFGELFQIFYACTFVLIGRLFHSYGIVQYLKNSYFYIICILIVSISAITIQNEMITVRIREIIPYLIAASAGALLMFNLAEHTNRHATSTLFIYIGQNTMLILALHFLSFKIISLIKIHVFDMPIKMLSCFPIIEEHNHVFWIVYTISGICIPLIIGGLLNNIKGFNSWQKLRETALRIRKQA